MANQDGEAAQRGDLRRWTERQDAERTAWPAPGVAEFEDRSTIVPSTD